MEVHRHTEAARKKWTRLALRFLLYLAVASLSAWLYRQWKQ